MWLRISLTAAFVLPTSLASAPRLTPPKPNDVIADAARGAVLHFLSTWRTAWLQGGDWQGFAMSEIRLRDVHCHYDGSFNASTARGSARPPSVIHHSSRRSMCPNWIPSDEQVPDDERTLRDGALYPAWRERIRDARMTLLDSLATLAKLRPSDGWITGQRVRFLIDQGQTDSAIALTRHCSAERAWCAQLAGFALHAAGDFARADSAFDAAAAAMSPKERCEWTDAELLLDRSGRSAYDHMSCDERVAANERLWWLATPLYSDPLDDRRSEHFARKVLIQLHSALSWDERFDWRERYGSEAVSEMLVRYGWPAFSVFMGAYQEQSHASWMYFYDSTRTATLEYPQDRLHLVPDWRGLTDPLRAPADAWQINMPALKADDEPAAQWWPAEHYGRANGSIVQLPNQTALLRRDADVLMATASALGSAKKRLSTDSEATALVRTTAPHKVQLLPHETTTNGSAVVLMGRIPSEPALVGAELRAARKGGLSARTRFSVNPPKPLRNFIPGETAISAPVLIAIGEGRPASPDEALHRMLGSTRVRDRKVGVYWETYGYKADDSVDVSVVITRTEPLSKIRKVGMLLRVAHNPNGSVAVRWGEPQAGHDSWSIPGVVPIQARSIHVDLSGIQPGRYNVQVVVGRPGAIPVSSSREFVLEGP